MSSFSLNSMLRGRIESGVRCCCSRRPFASTSTWRAPSSARATSLPTPVLDLDDVLHDPDFVRRNLVDRRYPLAPTTVDEIRKLEFEAVELRRTLQDVRERRNAMSKAKGGPKGPNQEAIEVKRLLKELEPKLADVTKRLFDLAIQLPNTSHPTSPIGDESKARLVKTFGPPISDPPPAADPARDHLHLSSPANLGWTDFPSASLVAGASWPYLLRDGALLEMALTNYAMSKAIKHGFVPVLTPDVVRSDVAERCGFRPRDGEAQQTYFLNDGSSEATLCLAGTAEIPLVALSAATISAYSELPRKFVALGRAFRAEAGARGADSRGLYRVHQFSKVEMVVICGEETSDRMLEDLRRMQEDILGKLGLSLRYVRVSSLCSGLTSGRVLDMPTEELGASAHRKYDIEAWMPGRGKWGELSSASNCTSYQSRRLSIRYRPGNTRNALEDIDIPIPAALEATALYPQLSANAGPKIHYAHTLNATAAAIPRLIVAILENGVVLEEGQVVRVRLPSVLKPFWIGEGEEAGRIEWVPEGEALRLL